VQIIKFANFAKNCAPQFRKFAQKLRTKAKIVILHEKAKFAQKLRPGRSRFSSGTDLSVMPVL